uniref:Protein kinase domain-containing protein n=1 Tax=Triticum urartu TaxID=4572 RepID=A0A8R7THC1_TRIUA
MICFFLPISLTILFCLLYLVASSSSCFFPLCQSCSVTLFMLLRCPNKSFVWADNFLLTTNRKKLKLTDLGLAREETITEMMTTETGTYRYGHRGYKSLFSTLDSQY